MSTVQILRQCVSEKTRIRWWALIGDRRKELMYGTYLGHKDRECLPWRNYVKIRHDPEDGGYITEFYGLDDIAVEILEEQSDDVAAAAVALDSVLRRIEEELAKNKERFKPREVLLKAKSLLLELRPAQ